MEIVKRNSVNVLLHKFDYLEMDKNSFAEATEWANGEGVDITINNKIYAFTWGQLKAINYLVLCLEAFE